MDMGEAKSVDPRILEIAKKIRRLRIEKGYSSYEKFAYDHDLPRVGYGNHEKGTNFTFLSFVRILDIHGLTMKEFFSDLDG